MISRIAGGIPKAWKGPNWRRTGFIEKDIHVMRFHIFAIRAILGVVFAVLLTRIFYQRAGIVHVAGLAVIMVGLAYFSEYLRNRKKLRDTDFNK
jgi:hypothetical protein